ncbi:enoyl-CoA hydratase/isomerase family protein [Pseudooceanicola sp. CBS1P-1]|uniref:2-(1,2-epoxy-1,2-dihydrophenyl)acetyl-CoA isomerase n=1 Tax=Pseudooceanicola albus TaxID=2692189 RepID=A0A6L7GAL8_9RHOB|nr:MULTISPECIES: enoyl-CoA hydratase-related protein [Pseudooceanicola]MBT9384462.1 enoyl-CoA hydratase/isomerase family protein [Pseudooceanicola endophyticus]MXN20637.1 2-(1,2-epoxy-1,2-dihydrophenyl)acetyl-CoA isomerase [Pseudooceanicola albus]
MSHETIDLEIDKGVARLTLGRPSVMNALNARMRAEIAEAVTGLPEDARVLVLTGQGRAFCSGQDLGDGTGLAGPELTRVLEAEYLPMIRALRDTPRPVITALNGAAVGAGASLALAADVVIAAESAYLSCAFARIGLVPDAGASWLLPRLAGQARALGAALFAEKIPARQALDWGLIWEVAPDADFEALWQARAAQLAAGPTEAYRQIRQLMRGSGDLEAQMVAEARAQGICGDTRDFREGVQAFLEKRPACFEGR